MANEENLIPLNRRAKSEQREIQSKGGKAWAEKRRAQRTMKQCADIALSLPPAKRVWNKLSRMGVEPYEIDNMMAVIVGQMMAAQAGDTRAAEFLRKVIGEDKESDTDALDRLDEMLYALNGAMQSED